jgi:hypothetical protein
MTHETRRPARRATLLEDWDVVRAAQHMIEVHGLQAAATAELRAASARELALVRQWRAIAEAIRAINRSANAKSAQAGPALS